MGVYVKGMKMPKCCIECPCFYVIPQGYVFCGLNEMTGSRPYVMAFEEAKLMRLDNCPMVEVPVPHGRLIDADALQKAVFHHLSIKGEEYLLPAEKSVFGNIIKAQTVIEAEGE